MERHRLELFGWIGAAFVLVALAIPWFLWGDATVVAGLPVWLWWHIAWMCLAAVVFWQFATRAWGVGIETGGQTDGDGSGTGPGSGDDGSNARGEIK